jgi:hypothetical protein
MMKPMTVRDATSMIQMTAEIIITNRITTNVALWSCALPALLDEVARRPDLRSNSHPLLGLFVHRVLPTATAVLPVFDPLRVQALVLRLVVVPLRTLGAAQRNPVSRHFFLSLRGAWHRVRLAEARGVGVETPSSAAIMDAAEGVSTPLCGVPMGLAGPTAPHSSYHLPRRAASARLYCFVPPRAPNRVRRRASSYMSGFSFFLSPAAS